MSRQKSADYSEHPLAYDSKSFVIHPNASLQTAREILDLAWEGRHTLAFSAGDVAKLSGTAVLVNWPQEDRKPYEDFFERYALGPVKVEYVETGWSNWDSYLQWMKDPEWANYRYAAGRCYTVGSKGCWVVCCAIAQRIFKIKEDATPLTVDQTLGPAGYTDSCLMYWDAMKKLGLRVEARTQSAVRARDFLLTGGILFIEVLPMSLMHFVVGVRYDLGRDDFYVLDPWKNKAGWLSDLYDGPESFRLVSKMEPEEPDPATADNEPTKLYAMHAQHDHQGLKAMADAVGAVKIVEDAGTMRQFDPSTFVVWRNWLSRDEAHHYFNGSTPRVHFEEQIAPFIDEYYGALRHGAVEDGLNEVIGPSDRDTNKRAIDWYLETSHYVDQYTGGEIKVCGLNPGPGAFPLQWIGDFYDVFKRCHRHGDYIGLHTYIPIHSGQLVGFWRDVAMQVVPIYEWCKHQGFRRVKFLGTEHGYIGGEFSKHGFHMDPLAGWANDLCLAGDWSEHLHLDRVCGDSFWLWNRQNGYPLRYLFYFTVMHQDKVWKENFPYYTNNFLDIQEVAEELYERWV